MKFKVKLAHVPMSYSRGIYVIKYRRNNMFLRQFFFFGVYTLSLTALDKSFQLANVNKALIDANCNNLFVDEVLCLGIVGQDCTTVAVVNSGDTCNSIAKAARTTLTTLLANNPNVNANCDNIRVGEVCCGLN